MVFQFQISNSQHFKKRAQFSSILHHLKTITQTQKTPYFFFNIPKKKKKKKKEKEMASRQPFPTNSKPNGSIIFLAITISASLIIFSAILYFLYYLWYSLVQRSRTSPFDGASPLKQLQNFSFKELKNATNNFSSSNCIGKGGSCSVYRGILGDGKLVAVKLLDSASFQCEHEFQNELKILGGLKTCPFVVSLLGFCVERENRLLVYEYMPNRSLQESLFSGSDNNNDNIDCSDTILSWGRRFSIILDVAKALAFLHIECEPAVVHGDVKPSNVLLDTEFRAKLSDFGLSRLKVDSEIGVGVDLFSQELWKSQELSGNSNAGVVGGEIENDNDNDTPPVESHENDEVDFALALQASASSKNSCRVYHNMMGLPINSLNFNFSPDCGSDEKGGNSKGKELSPNENGGEEWSKFVPYDDELSSMDHSKELSMNATAAGEDGSRGDEGAKQWGKDWWWKQDEGGEFCSKDYVMEWIGNQICHSTDPDWDEEKGAVEENISSDHPKQLDKCEEVCENPVQEPRFECGDGGVAEKGDSKRWRVRGRKHRKMHEWWKEEQMDEVRKKGKRVKRIKVPHFGLGKCFMITSRRKKLDDHIKADDENMEFSFRKGWRKRKNSRSMGSEDLFSRELSSTTSMRGTLCYVAPEYNGYGYGYSMEKADIYSLGVLILVIISGRRPLHVLSSPMKLERANLVSWCRSLAHSGNTLELVDQRLKDEYDKVQASLCINLALACLQKMPELRPDIGDIVKILKAEMELPSLPFEFSPSPPPKLHSRSRRRLKSGVD